MIPRRALPLLAVAVVAAPATAADYLGQTPPGTAPVLFAPGVVNTAAIELNGVFTPDGAEFFFSRQVDGVSTIFHAVRRDGAWSDPAPLRVYEDGAPALAVDMTVSGDGRFLYFLGQHRHDADSGTPGQDLWVCEKSGDAWGFARVVPAPVSTADGESYPCVVADGSLYFTSDRAGGLGPWDLYRAQRRADGSFEPPVNVGAPVNTSSHEGDTFVSPDERTMIVASRRPGGYGLNDLYASFRSDTGAWSEPVNLGPAINGDQVDFCPMITPDGRYLFFSRRIGASWEETTGCDVYWVDARVVDALRPARSR